MAHLPRTSSDEELISFVDRWAALMEAEEYEAAYGFTSHDPYMKWTPELLRLVIKSYDECLPSQKVTVAGELAEIRQTKDVTRWPVNPYGYLGQIWYDLNIDGYASDLTATFGIREDPAGLTIELTQIHVM